MPETTEQLQDELTPAYAAVRTVCRRKSRGLFYSLSFLPKEKRSAACAVYCFCSMIREVMTEDSHSAPAGAVNLRHRPLVASREPSHDHGSCGCGDGEGKISLFRGRLDEIYEGRIELPHLQSRSEAQHTLYAISHVVKQHSIPKQLFVDLAESCLDDLRVTRYATWTSVQKFALRASGAVAKAMSALFGAQHSQVSELAGNAGVAIQLTGFLCNLKADVARDRIYLPLEDLAQFRCSQSDLQNSRLGESFIELMKFEIARARTLFQKGAEGICWLADDGSKLSAAAILVMQLGLLDEIERRGFDIFEQPITLSPARRFRQLSLAWRLARRRPDEPLPVFSHHIRSKPSVNLQ